MTAAIDKSLLIESALSGHGVPIDRPTAFIAGELESASSTELVTGDLTQSEIAIEILDEGGWQKNNIGLWEKKIGENVVTLSVTLRTGNDPVFAALTEKITASWRDIGVEVVAEKFEQSDLVQSVIRPREFEAILFGFDVGRSYDLYPFWHSSQQDDPGLNIAQYANVEVDSLLEDARTEQFGPTRLETLNEASETISKEYPAIFIFQPTFTYVLDNRIKPASMKQISRPADRFANIAEWHTNTESLWPFFRSDDQTSE